MNGVCRNITARDRSSFRSQGRKQGGGGGARRHSRGADRAYSAMCVVQDKRETLRRATGEDVYWLHSGQEGMREENTYSEEAEEAEEAACISFTDTTISAHGTASSNVCRLCGDHVKTMGFEVVRWWETQVSDACTFRHWRFTRGYRERKRGLGPHAPKKG